MALNNLEEDDTAKANDIIVPPALLSDAEGSVRDEGGAAVIQRAVDGEAVLLVGRAWEEEDESDDDDDDSTPATTLLSSLTDGNVNNAAAAADVRAEGESAVSENDILAAVHRSPTLEPEQERILLTVDLVDWN